MADGLPPVVLLSTADFNAEVWTNKQRLAVRLAEATRVTYVESFGLRTPRVSRSDLRRIWSRVLPVHPGVDGRRSPSEPVPRDLTIVRPAVLPFHALRPIRAINRRLVDAIPLENLEGSVLWTFSPLTYGLEARARSVVYHSVDLLHAQPGMPSAELLRAERRLVDSADRVIASSQGVQAHLRQIGRRDVELWENVADTRLFQSIVRERRRQAVFAGNLTPSKVDAALILQVADLGVDVVVAGPGAIDGTVVSPELRRVLQHPRVRYLGTVSPVRLADEFAHSMVGLIPYQLNDYTSGVFPLKVYEYLAAGLAVVSTRLPSLRDCAPDVRLEATAEFAGAVLQEVDRFDPAAAHTRSLGASGHSWEHRAGQAIALLSELRRA